MRATENILPTEIIRPTETMRPTTDMSEYLVNLVYSGCYSFAVTTMGTASRKRIVIE